MARFRLTKKDLSTSTGQQLLELLMRITSDGELTSSEVEELQAWIQNHGGELAAASYLREVLETILRDRRITVQDRWDLLRAIEKVLPVEERDLVKMRSRETDEPATQKQLNFLAALNVRHDGDLTKWDAAKLIDEAKAQQNSPFRGCGSTLLSWVLLALMVWGLYRCGTSHK